MTLSKQDKAAGLKPGTLAPSYDPAVALRMLEGLAEGQTISELTKIEGNPSRPTWYRWLALYPDLKQAADTAREVSAQSLEDEMLDIARMLKGKNDFTAVRTDQLKVVLQQLRWSAARRDPARFGQKQTPEAAIAIQINTSLDLGQGGTSAPGHANVYALEARVPLGDDEVLGAEPEEPDDDPPEPLTAPENPEKLKLTPHEGLAVKPPRRHPKHKTPTQLRATLASQSRRKTKGETT